MVVLSSLSQLSPVLVLLLGTEPTLTLTEKIKSSHIIRVNVPRSYNHYIPTYAMQIVGI